LQSNQIKFISSKPKYKITKTKTIQLVSYSQKGPKRHWYFLQKRTRSSATAKSTTRPSCL